MIKYFFLFLCCVTCLVYSEEIKSLIFVAPSYSISKKPIDCNGVCVLSDDIPDKELFSEKMSLFIGTSLDMDNLEMMRKTALDFFKKRGQKFVIAKIPPDQDITTGQVYVVIIFAKLGQIKCEGNRYFSDKLLKSKISIKEGSKINLKEIDQDMEWINNNPFRGTTVLYEAGENIGETDILLKTKDALPLRVYAGYDNTGNEVAGYSRYLTGFYWANAFGLDHRMDFQFKSAATMDKWWSVAGDYEIPLPWHNMLKFYGSYIKSHSPLNMYTDLQGKSWNFSFCYDIPIFVRSSKHNLIFGYDFKSTNNYLSFVQDLIYDRYIDISQFPIKYKMFLADKMGETNLIFNLVLSPGKMTKNNTSKAFSIEREGAKSNYAYFRFGFDRKTYLIKNFSWNLEGLFQLSTGKLMPSEAFSVGGYRTVRGYQENAVIGDKGFLIKNELYFPPINFNLKQNFPCTLNFLGFIDLGWADDVDKSVMDKHAAILASIGPGFRFEASRFLNIRFDYGWQLKGINDRFFEKAWDSAMHLGVMVGF
jgi:hemolysin activation/secretion protein